MKFLFACIPTFLWFIFIIYFSIRENNKLKKIPNRYTAPDLLIRFFRKQISEVQFKSMKNFFIVLFSSLILVAIIQVVVLTIVFRNG